MSSARESEDRKCAVDGCAAFGGSATGRCLAHLDEAELATALDEIGDSGKVDARGVQLGADLLAQVLAAVPRTRDGRCRFSEADFREA
jgi:hypothetical protein